MPVEVLDAALITAGAATAVFAGSPLVRALFRLVGRRQARTAPSEPPSGAAEPDATTAVPAHASAPAAAQALDDPAMLPGGQWIGYLERLAVFATLTAGWKEGLALILAMKGLARYPELTLTTSRVAEKFIIGTLASVLFAAACAGVTAWLTGHTR